MRVRSISLLLFVITFNSAISAQVKFIGVVQNKFTKEKLMGATIRLSGTNNTVLTDSAGLFSIIISKSSVVNITNTGYEQLIYVFKSDTSYRLFEMIPAYSDQMQITILGSRAGQRSVVNRPVPIDIISAKDLQSTGQTDLAQMLQFTSPSFLSAKTGLNGIANYADPAALKGMSPDQSLVLVNGKRRHQFAAISNTLLPGKGAVITDLNAIPALALDKLEIMRDGAAAQYGSDAIAGIINLNLKKNDHGGEIRSEVGVTGRGDGISLNTSVNKGWSLNKPGSFLNLTIALQSSSGTDRSDPYNSTIYTNNKLQDDSIRNARGVWPTDKPAYVMKYGSNQTESFQFFLNVEYPLKKNWKWYGFGGNSNKYVVAYGFFRSAKFTDPNSSPIYPDGYTPLLPGRTADYSFFTGFEHISPGGWKFDLSTGYGYSHLDLYSEKSSNPSLGISSPTNFYVGRNAFGQQTSDVNISKTLKGFSIIKSMNFALGSQLRQDLFKLREGDSASYAVGPLALSAGKATGSSGRPGIALADRTSRSRINFATYIDLEGDVKEKWIIGLAGRFEHYNDFGGNLSGKFAALYKLNAFTSFRGSINRGFRAPSLQQIYNGQTTSNAQNGLIRQTKQIPVSDKRLTEIGIPFPKPELSWNYNMGLTFKPSSSLLLTVDAYQIKVSNRIIISEVLQVSSAIPALLRAFPISTGIREVTFFTNHIDTRTQGVDVVSTWKHQFSTKRKVQASLAWTINKTRIIGYRQAPDELTLGSTSVIKLIDTISESLITSAQPNQKVIGTVNFQFGQLQLLFRATYFGKVTAWEKASGSPHRSQTFGGKTITDFSTGYNISNKWKIHLGINNFFDVYPDRVDVRYASYTSGQVPYTRSAIQFGFNGRFYYSNLTFQF